MPRTNLRTFGRFLLGGATALAALLPAETASALSPYLVVPAPAVAEASAAYRYANMTEVEAYAELDKRKVPYKKADPIAGVVAPVRLTGKLHGVAFHSAIPAAQRATSVYEVLDARLALALDDFAKILERHDIDEVVHYSLYRPNVPRADHDVHDDSVGTSDKASPAPVASLPAAGSNGAVKPASLKAHAAVAASALPGASTRPDAGASARALPGAATRPLPATSARATTVAPSAKPAPPPAGKASAARLPALPERPLPSSTTKGHAGTARGAKQKAPDEAAASQVASKKSRIEPARAEVSPPSPDPGGRAAKPGARPAAKSPAPTRAAAASAPSVAPRSGASAAPRSVHPRTVGAGARASLSPQKAGSTGRPRAATPPRPEAAAIPVTVAPRAPAAPVSRQTWAAPGTRHPAGLAIDVGRLKKRDGQWISVAGQFRGKIGAKTCGEGVRNADTPEARELLRSIVCEANDLGVFTYVLTPNYNAAHNDHFHMEVRPQVKWFLYQ